jgi:hypothetical protein
VDPYDPTDEFVSDGGERRIREIEGDAEDIPEVNFGIFRSSKDYDLPASKDISLGGPSTRSVVNRPYTLGQVVSLMSEFFERFPRDEPLLVQSAFWMRWFAGMHFFEDANHRTGMSSLRTTMRTNGTEPPPKLDDVGDKAYGVLDDSKEVRDYCEVSEENMFEKDDLYEVWKGYFDDVLGL